MSFKHTAKHIDVNYSVKSYAEERFAKLAKHLLRSGVWQIHYSLGKRGQYLLEVIVLQSNKTFKASDSADSFFAAIDVVVQKLSKQIMRVKSQVKKHKNFHSSKEGKLLDLNSRLEYQPTMIITDLPIGSHPISKSARSSIKKSAA